MVDTKADAIQTWLTVLADGWEKQPDSRETHLSYPDKLFVYRKVCNESPVFRQGDPPRYEYFVNVWNAQCDHINLKKSMRLTLCDICVLAKEALEKHRENGSSPALMAPISTGLNDHYEDVRRMRQLPLLAKHRALCSPDELLVIAIDGSDQSSYATSYFSQVTKDTCAGWRMRMKLIGALVYGRLLHFFTLGSNWESGSNLTIEVLHRTLVALWEGQADGVALPRKLHLQCYNCSRENKNRFFIGYLHLLVYYNVFDEIELHFGLKGHTHDEIDQVFSRVGVHLKARNAFTRTHLGEHIKDSYNALPVELTHLYNCANLRDLLAPCMFAVPHITLPQAFRIAIEPTTNQVRMQVQRRGYEDKWGTIGRNGDYGQEYMNIMKSWTSLADTPPCPRKVVEEIALNQHRAACKAAEDRMRGLLMSSQSRTLDDVKEENEKEIQTLSDSEPLAFEWNTTIYCVREVVETPTEQGLSVGGEMVSHPDNAGGGNAVADEMDWTAGRFVAFAQDASNAVPLLVGKILYVRSDGEGKQVVVHWYSPSRVASSARRSKYGRGTWSPDYDPKNVSQPHKGVESVQSACTTFDRLLESRKIPQRVWEAVAKEVPPPEEEEEEELREVGGPGGRDDASDSGAPEEGRVSSSVPGTGVGSQVPAPASPRPLPLPSVRLTAAFSRSRRGQHAGEVLALQGDGGSGGSEHGDDSEVTSPPASRLLPPLSIRLTAAYERPRRGGVE